MKEADRNFIKSMARDLMVHQGLSCYEALKQTLRFMSHYNETMQSAASVRLAST